MSNLFLRDLIQAEQDIAPLQSKDEALLCSYNAAIAPPFGVINHSSQFPPPTTRDVLLHAFHVPCATRVCVYISHLPLSTKGTN